jgi:hypothetical protein
MTSKRPLLIPHKRSLLPPTTHTTCNQKHVYKVFNPNTVPATTHMKPPIDTNDDEDGSMNEPAKDKATRTEFSFASAPQPFLDPPTWEVMLKRAHTAAMSASTGESASASASNSVRRRGENLSESSGAETPDQQRIRREREAEYGSMAIRGRTSVSGRGRRTRASRGRGYWGGQL